MLINAIRSFALVLCFLALVSACDKTNPNNPLPPQKPNVVLILADDLGIGDVGIYRQGPIQTPHIDQLARNGVKFTQAYVTHPVCSPSRAGLITGLYQQRHGWEFNVAQRDKEYGMSTEVNTMADTLSEIGYKNALIGKWHLGHQRQHHPLNRGFHDFFGVLDGGTSYINSNEPGTSFVSINSSISQRAPLDRPNAIYRNFNEVKIDDYLTDVFTDEAVNFIRENQHQPFFLFLSHITPHTPLQTIDKYSKRYEHLSNNRARIYASMVASLDDSVGRIVKELETLGLSENTLIVFASDNGCASYIEGACSNAPYSGFKRFHHEGGIRVPFIMSWHKFLPRGETYNHPVITLDLYSTFVAAAGRVGFSTIDSVNLIPFVKRKINSSPHEYLYWRSGPTHAIRDERWKLMRYSIAAYTDGDLGDDGRLTPPKGGWPHTFSSEKVTLLFDLKSDPSEQNNLADEHPEVVERLTAQYETWASSLAKPMIPAIRSTLTEINGTTVQLIF